MQVWHHLLCLSSIQKKPLSNAVEVVMDEGFALYFSRHYSLGRDRFNLSHDENRRALLYVISVFTLIVQAFVVIFTWEPSPLDQMLEQLRVLWYGEKIHVAKAAVLVSGLILKMTHNCRETPAPGTKPRVLIFAVYCKLMFNGTGIQCRYSGWPTIDIVKEDWLLFTLMISFFIFYAIVISFLFSTASA